MCHLEINYGIPVYTLIRLKTQPSKILVYTGMPRLTWKQIFITGPFKRKILQFYKWVSKHIVQNGAGNQVLFSMNNLTHEIITRDRKGGQITIIMIYIQQKYAQPCSVIISHSIFAVLQLCVNQVSDNKLPYRSLRTLRKSAGKVRAVICMRCLSQHAYSPFDSGSVFTGRAGLGIYSRGPSRVWPHSR